MKNPLIINIRCSCIEEYINIQRLHKEYTRQLRTGEIMSVFVGAELAVPGEYAVVDKLMEKGGQCRKVPAVAFCPKVEDIRNITKEFTKADFEELKKEVEKGAVIISGPMPEEEIALPQAVDGGVDAIGNPPLPEEERPLPEAYGQPVPQPALQEDERIPVESSVHKSFAFEEEPVPANLFPGPAVELPDDRKSFKHVPETLDNDVPCATGVFGPQEFDQAAPSVAEESDDGQDYNTTYAG